MRFTLSLLLTAFLFISCENGEREQPSETAEPTETRQLDFTAEVSFLTADGDVVTTIDAAVADDDASRSEGLMDVHDLPSNAGMLFIFEDEEPRSFWMANTPLSLDIIYANSEFEIIRVHQNTAPYSQQSIESEEPAKYVIEVNAGFAMQNDIIEGMYIDFSDDLLSGN